MTDVQQRPGHDQPMTTAASSAPPEAEVEVANPYVEPQPVPKSDENLPPSDVVADVGTFYDLFNDFLNQEFALTLGDFAETYCGEFQNLVNEQIISTNHETHNPRYHEMYREFRDACEEALERFCEQYEIQEKDFAIFVEQLQQGQFVGTRAIDGRRNSGGALRGGKMNKKDLPAEKQQVGIKVLETRQLLLGFYAATEYKQFMQFMMEYIGEQEEEDEFHHHNDQTGDFVDHDHDEDAALKTEEEREWAKIKEC